MTLAGGDIVPGYNTISTMGTLGTMAAGGLPALCQQKGLLARLSQLYVLCTFSGNVFSKMFLVENISWVFLYSLPSRGQSSKVFA